MHLRRTHGISMFLVALLPACSPVGALNPLGSTPNPAGALFAASQDCEGMALVLADPTQSELLRGEVRRAMDAGGCL